ncbi:MAG: sulfotransferase family protein [Hyphomonadaceae bacterium]|nr:sulfotransferase family protein [Hyphomonadaceae bacterium]
MVISDAQKFIFVHIPKTAGTSVMSALAPEGRKTHPLCLTTKHETYPAFVERHGEQLACEYTSFAFVRHPLARFVSHFRYLKSRPRQFPEMAPIESLEAYAEAVERGDMEVIRSPARVMAQCEWTHSGETQLVDHVFRHEDLPDAFDKVCDLIGLSPRPLPRQNQSSFSLGSIAPTVADFVARYYARDYAVFGYEI